MPKKINPEDFDKMPLHGQGNSSVAFNAIFALHVGEALIIEKSEWKPKYPPTSIVNRIQRKYSRKFICGALPDRTGWAVKRVK